MNNSIIAILSQERRSVCVRGLWQYDYGRVLEIHGLDLPSAVEIHFSTSERGGESETRIGVTTDRITKVDIPNALLAQSRTQDYMIYAFVYVEDEKFGYTEYKIMMTVWARPKPGEEVPDEDKDHPFADAIQAVNAAADRTETAERNAKESADKASQTAEEFDTHADELKQCMTKDISDTAEKAKTAGVEAVEKAKDAAIQEVDAATTRAENAASDAAKSKAAAEDAAEQADKSRVAAETVEKYVAEAGRTALTGIASAKNDAAETIETVKTGAVKDVDAARETGVEAVTDARTAAEQSLSEAKTDGVAAIETAKTEGLQAIDKAKADIETARSGAIKDIDAAKTSGVQAVEAAENEGVAAVNAAVEAGKTNFVTDESLTLSGRAADAKIVGDELAKKADQTELEDVKKRQNILVGSETGSRVCVTDAFEAPLEGLVLYGKSTQVTTTGAQLLDLSDLIGKTETKNGATYKINEDQSISVSGTPTEYTSFYLKAMSLKAGSYYFLSNSDDYKVFVQLIGAKVNMNNGFTLDEDADGIGVCVVFNVVSNNTKSFNMTFTSMLNAGETLLPWEPYTGGKPSPSPNYPQEIKNAKGEVVVHGKNLFGGRFYYANYANGVLKIDGSRKADEVKLPFAPMYETFGVCKVIKCQKGKTYVISVTNPNKNAAVGMAEYENIEKAIDVNKALGFAKVDNKILKKSYTAKSGGILVCGIAGTWTDGKTTVHECTESELLQVEEASEATSYEPYHNPQTLTLSAPNGLPGIMVTSGGNYTDENGQQWICDEVDLERGVYVQRVYSVIVDGVNVAFSQMGPYCNINLMNMPCAKLIGGQRTTAESTFTSESWNFNPDSGFLYIVKENYAEILNESCRRHNGEVIYALATPIETPLSEADIAAYRALATYGPTTILETDGAGMKLDYQRDVNIVIKQLTDTIASMTN